MMTRDVGGQAGQRLGVPRLSSLPRCSLAFYIPADIAESQEHVGLAYVVGRWAGGGSESSGRPAQWRYCPAVPVFQRLASLFAPPGPCSLHSPRAPRNFRRQSAESSKLRSWSGSKAAAASSLRSQNAAPTDFC